MRSCVFPIIYSFYKHVVIDCSIKLNLYPVVVTCENLKKCAFVDRVNFYEFGRLGRNCLKYIGFISVFCDLFYDFRPMSFDA